MLDDLATPTPTVTSIPTGTATPQPTATARATQTVVVAPTVARPRGDGTSLQALICAYGWPCQEALAVIYGPTPPNAYAPNGCGSGESGGNPNAYNAGNYGLLQINYASHVDKLLRVTGSTDPALLFIPEVNLDVGYIIWQEQGWGPWSCRL